MTAEQRKQETQKIVKHITSNWESSANDLAKQLGLTPSTIRKWKQRILSNKVYKTQIVKAKEDEAKVKISTLEKNLEEATYQLQAYKSIVNSYEILKTPSKDTIKIVDTSLGTEDRAIATFVLSDWHIEETVKSESVNGLNEFNQDIAKKRVNNVALNIIKLFRLFRTSTKIDAVVLALLGDFFTSNIHEELTEVTSLRPVEAAIWARDLLIAVIKYVREHVPDDIPIVVQCASGNHSRITKKTHFATEHGNSLEHFMYHTLAEYFKSHTNIKFNIPQSYLGELDYYGHSIRFHHGHAIKFQGGVGGITIPVRKARAQWNSMKPSALDVFGHFHQFIDGGDFIVNGSLIGYSAYAVAIKAAYEPPRQVAFLFDSKRGKTLVAPIFVE